jgi:hypothetical protein
MLINDIFFVQLDRMFHLISGQMGRHEYNKYNVHSYNEPLVKIDIFH